MPEDAQQVTEATQEPEKQLTGDEVRQIVTDAVSSLVESDNAKYDSLSRDLATLGNDLRTLASDEGSEQSDSDVVYVVALDSSQLDTVKSFGRVLCTEGLLLLIVCAISAGLLAWRLVSDRWRG